MNDEEQIAAELDEDELAAPADRFDAKPHDRVDEYLRLRMADDRRKKELAANDAAAGKVRSKVADDCLDLRELRHL
jgi:hypothetical protein